MDHPLFDSVSLFVLWDNSRATFKRLYRTLSEKEKGEFKRFCATEKKNNNRFIEILKYTGQTKGPVKGESGQGLISKKELIRRLDEMTSQVLMLTSDADIRDNVNLCRRDIKRNWKVLS